MKEIKSEVFYGIGVNQEDAISDAEKSVNKFIEDGDIADELYTSLINYQVKVRYDEDDNGIYPFKSRIILSYWEET